MWMAVIGLSRLGTMLLCSNVQSGTCMHSTALIRVHLQVIVKGKRVGLMSSGDCFGEAVLYHTNVKRTASIYTRTYAQIFLLSKNAVNIAFAAHPAAYAELRRKARLKLQSYAGAKIIKSRSFSNQSSNDGSVLNVAAAATGVSIESARKSMYNPSGNGEGRGSSMCAIQLWQRATPDAPPAFLACTCILALENTLSTLLE